MDRDVLFGIFAVQLGFARPGAVMAELSAWLSDKKRSLPEHLVANGDITEQQRTMLDGIVDESVKVHGGDVKKTVETLGGEQAVYASFGGSVVVDERGDVSIVPEVELDGDTMSNLTAVTHEAKGRYKTEGDSEIGRGGIGRILVAYDEHLCREIAVKELLVDTGKSMPSQQASAVTKTSALAARFLREARVTGQLEHPNIVPVHEVGQRENGSFYYTMKLVRGRTLAEALKACSTTEDRLKLLPHYADLCHAIAYAHSRGVIHRDIKTENVMLGEFGETVVLDWGLAKVKGKADIRGKEIERELRIFQDAGTGKTVDGAAIGTPAYMSPEQADGAVDDIDERSDVWSLGAVLFEVLTGRAPFEGVNPYEIIGKVLKDEVPPAPEVDSKAPPELAAVASKALQREKSERYQAAKEVADETDAFMSGGRVGVYRYSSLELLKGFVARNKALSALAMTIVLLIITSSVVLFNAYRRAEDERAAAERNEAQAQQNELEAELNLATAFQEKAEQLFVERRVLASRIYSAAALVHHPCNVLELSSATACNERFRGGNDLRTRAISNVYQSSLIILARPDWSIIEDAPLQHLDVSADGTIVVTSSSDGKTKVWDPRTHKLLATLGAPLSERRYRGISQAPIAISSDGTTIAMCEHNEVTSLWSPSGTRLGQLDETETSARFLAFSPGADLLASSSDDGRVVLWNRAVREIERSIETGRAGRVRLSFSKTGHMLATAHAEDVALWNAGTGELIGRIEGVKGAGRLAFSPDGQKLAGATVYRTIEIIDVEARKRVQSLTGHAEGVTAVGYSPDGKLLATGSSDRSVWLWDAQSLKTLFVVEGHRAPITDLRFMPDGASLISIGEDGSIRSWKLDRGITLPLLEGHTSRLWGIEYSPDGKRLVSVSDDATVRLWHLRSRGHDVLEEMNGHVTSVSFTSDGERLAVSYNNRGSEGVAGVKVFDMNERRVHKVINEPLVFSVKFSSDGKRLATCRLDGVTKLWDAETGLALREVEDDGAGQGHSAFSPDGRWLVTGGSDKTIRIWDVSTGKRLKTLRGHEDLAYNFDFTEDGQRLLSCGKHGSILLWDMESGEKIRDFIGHERWVNRATIAKGGELIASASDEGTVRLWSMETGENLLIIKVQNEAMDVAFSPDGQQLAVGDQLQIKLYPLDLSLFETDPEALLEQAEREAGLKLRGFELTSADDE